jgi:ABC-type dipeptide/oligopeptide/nickel transport system permease component
MLTYLTRRLLAFIPVLWAVATLVFLGLRLTPGDPLQALYAEALIPQERLDAYRAELGLDRPLAEQYLTFMRNLLRGDLGASLLSGRPVTLSLLERAGPTAALALSGLAVALVIGLALGVLAATRPGAVSESLANTTIALSLSLPVAWTGLLGLWLAAHLFPLHAAPLLSLSLPALVLGFAAAGPIANVMRASLTATRRESHLLAARARGVSGWSLLRHALRAALVPVVNITALQAAFLFGGTVVTETVFARPGLGRLLVDALLRKDFPLVQGLVLVVAGLYLFFNLLADLCSAALDPRLRSQWQ